MIAIPEDGRQSILPFEAALLARYETNPIAPTIDGILLIAIVIAHTTPRVSLTIYATAPVVFVISMTLSRSAVTLGPDERDGSRA